MLTPSGKMVWRVENRLHWRFDVVTNEDQDRAGAEDGPHNLAVLRYVASKAMQKEGFQGSLRGRFKRAGLDDRFFFKPLGAF